MTTIQDIHKQIGDECEKIGIDISKLRFKTAIQWFPVLGNIEASFQLAAAEAELQTHAIDQKTFAQRRAQIVAATGPVVIRVGDLFPFNPAMRTVAIFGDDAEWRVYALPVTPDDLNKPHPSPACYTLGRHAAVLDLEAMSMDTFIAEIVDEWSTVDSGQGARKVEEELIVAYLQSLPDDYSVKQAAQDIADGVHLEGDGEEDEEELGAEQQQQPQVPAAPQAVANGQTAS